MNRSSRNAALLAALSASLAPSFAQDGSELKAITVEDSQERSSIDLTSRSQSGSKLGLTARETPASAETVDQQQMQARGARTFTEALRGMAGVSGGGNPAAPTTLSLRGFTNVLYLHDGMRSSGAMMANRVQDTWNYERIEVLRGPASVLDGEGAIGGVVNFVTKRPDRNNPNREAMLSYGSYGSTRAAVGLGGAVGETGAYRIDYSRSDIRAGHVPRSGERNEHLTTGLSFDLGSSVKLDLSFDYLRDNNDAYWGTPLVPARFATQPLSVASTPDGRVIDRRMAGINYNVLDDENRSETYTARARLSGRLGDWTWRNELAGNKARRVFRNSELAVFAAPGFVDRDQTLITHDQRYWSNRFDARRDATLGTMQNRFIAGAEYAQTSFENLRRFSDGKPGTSALLRVPALFPTLNIYNFSPALMTGAGNQVDNFAKVRTTSLFAENALKITPKMTLVGGIRHDRTQVARSVADLNLLTVTAFDTDYRATSTRIGAVYDLTLNSSVYAQFSNAVLPVGSLALLSAANSAFPLSKGRQLEVGFKQSLPEAGLEWTAAAYKIEMDNVLSRDPANPNRTVNNGQQSSRGVELSAAWRPSPSWTVSGNLALLEARFDSLVEAGGVSRVGNRPPNVPERVANLFATYRPQGSRADWSVGLNHSGPFYTDNANTIRVAGATTVDAGVSYALNPFVLSLRVRNLTDKTYATWVGRAVSQVVLAPGRSFEVAASMAF